MFRPRSPSRTSPNLRSIPLLVGLGSVVAWGCGVGEAPDPAPQASATAEPIQIAASIPPLADLASRLGGSAVEVFSIMPPGASPHSFSLAPREARRLEQAHLVLRVGHAGLPFEEALLRSTHGKDSTPTLAMVDPETDPTAAPHLWLSTTAMAELAGRITDELVSLDPTNEATYQHNLEVLRSDISQLRDDLWDLLGMGPEGRSFLVYHPAWESFATEFGLTEIAVERDGKEPSARNLTRLIEQLRARHPTTLFVQAGITDRGAGALARELGLEIVPLDPLPANWFLGLEAAAEKIAQGLIDP